MASTSNNFLKSSMYMCLYLILPPIFKYYNADVDLATIAMWDV